MTEETRENERKRWPRVGRSLVGRIGHITQMMHCIVLYCIVFLLLDLEHQTVLNNLGHCVVVRGDACEER